MKMRNKRHLQLIALNHLFDFEFKKIMKFMNDFTKKKTHSFSVNNTSLLSHNPLRFKKTFL